MKSTLGERGQVTIPSSIRRQLGLQPGTELEVDVEDGAVVFRRPGIGPALDRWQGSASNPYESTDTFIEALRGGPAGDDPA